MYFTDIVQGGSALELFTEYLQKKNVATEKQEILLEIGTVFQWEYKEIFLLYLSCFCKKNYAKENKKILCQIGLEEDVLVCAEKKVIFQHNELLKLLAVCCDLVEKILPLGTVVELKKEFLTEIPGVENINQIRLVITNRFLVNDERTFHTYAGVIYPISNFNGKEVMCFSENLINKVVFQGFSDEQEDAYVTLMKYELLIEQEKISAGFSAVK